MAWYVFRILISFPRSTFLDFSEVGSSIWNFFNFTLNFFLRIVFQISEYLNSGFRIFCLKLYWLMRIDKTILQTWKLSSAIAMFFGCYSWINSKRNWCVREILSCAVCDFPLQVLRHSSHLCWLCSNNAHFVLFLRCLPVDDVESYGT